MIDFFKSVFEVGKDLIELIEAMGKLGALFFQLFYILMRLINFILNLGWPLNAIVAAPFIVLAYFLRELICRVKLLLIAGLGLWIFITMSVAAVRNFGMALFWIGLGLFILDFLVRKGKIKLPSLFGKKEKKKEKN